MSKISVTVLGGPDDGSRYEVEAEGFAHNKHPRVKVMKVGDRAAPIRLHRSPNGTTRWVADYNAQGEHA